MRFPLRSGAGEPSAPPLLCACEPGPCAGLCLRYMPEISILPQMEISFF